MRHVPIISCSSSDSDLPQYRSQLESFACSDLWVPRWMGNSHPWKVSSFALGPAHLHSLKKASTLQLFCRLDKGFRLSNLLWYFEDSVLSLVRDFVWSWAASYALWGRWKDEFESSKFNGWFRQGYRCYSSCLWVHFLYSFQQSCYSTLFFGWSILISIFVLAKSDFLSLSYCLMITQISKRESAMSSSSSRSMAVLPSLHEISSYHCQRE